MIKEYEQSIKEIVSEFTGFIWEEKRNLLSGILEINHTFCDEHIIDSFMLEILVPYNYKEVLPRVYSKDKKVSMRFNHIYKDGMLCLATDADQLCFFADGHNLVDWIKAYVIPYFFAVNYFQKYKVYPFGERAHGEAGIISFYEEKFKIKSRQRVLNMLDCIVNHTYRGHLLCPCGSGKRIRTCHKDIIINWKQDKYQYILKNDYILLNGGKDKIERNKNKTK